MTLSVGEPKRNKDYQKAHFPKRTTDDTESQAMARFAVVEQPDATPAPSAADGPAARGRRPLAGPGQADDPGHQPAAQPPGPRLPRARHPDRRHRRRLGAASCSTSIPPPNASPQAHLASLEKIPYLSSEQAEALHQAARQSVASLRGDVAEALVRDLVAQVRHSQQAEQHLRQLLTAAFADLPASPHVQVVTIPGIGEATAAVLVAKIVDIDRFATPDHLVGYFGVFPEENSSGVDKQGKPLPAGHAAHVAARATTWSAPTSGTPPESPSVHNPAIRALYRRLRAKGKRGDVAMGHCMRKLLHLVFAVWKTDRPFDEDHFPWEGPGDTPSSTTTPARPTRQPHPPPTRRPWATSGTCPRKKWSPRPPPP